jgi:hypothetical protein
LADPKEWRVLIEFVVDCLLLGVGAVGAGGGLSIASFHIPGVVGGSPVFGPQGSIKSVPISDGRTDEALAGGDSGGVRVDNPPDGGGTGGITNGLWGVVVGPVVLFVGPVVVLVRPVVVEPVVFGVVLSSASGGGVESVLVPL